MGSRGVRRLGFVLAVFLFAVPVGEARQTAQVPIPLPTPGNVTVARLSITGGTGKQALPRLTLAGTAGLPADAYVAADVVRSGQGPFQATVAVFDRLSVDSPNAPASGKAVTVRVPAGYALAGPPQVARDVLYSNPIPRFRLLTGGVATILAGSNPPRLAPARVVADAQRLAFERSVPLVDAGLLGLEYVAVQLSKAGPSALSVTLGLYHRSQVNAIELRFSDGTKVSKVSGPTGVDAILVGSAAQLVASRGFYEDGILYGFTVHLSKMPKKGEYVTVRASAHYFESSLPFTERFALG